VGDRPRLGASRMHWRSLLNPAFASQDMSRFKLNFLGKRARRIAPQAEAAREEKTRVGARVSSSGRLSCKG